MEEFLYEEEKKIEHMIHFINEKKNKTQYLEEESEALNKYKLYLEGCLNIYGNIMDEIINQIIDFIKNKEIITLEGLKNQIRMERYKLRDQLYSKFEFMELTLNNIMNEIDNMANNLSRLNKEDIIKIIVKMKEMEDMKNEYIKKMDKTTQCIEEDEEEECFEEDYDY